MSVSFKLNQPQGQDLWEDPGTYWMTICLPICNQVGKGAGHRDISNLPESSIAILIFFPQDRKFALEELLLLL